MSKIEIAKNQIKLQGEIQNAGFNLVTCGNCATLLIHRIEDDRINCFCGLEMELSDCPDYWYEGMELSEQFKD